jgi:tetrahydromethanopterin S-methyltransferase subunit C
MTLDRTREQIKFNTEIIKLIIVLMITTGGGALTLIITGLHHARETILAAAGMIVAVICWIITFKVYKITQDLINRL